jgi:hypothetical protein
MQIGVLDMLCVTPHNEIEKYGIPLLRSVLEKDVDETLEKWVISGIILRSSDCESGTAGT